jgi:hypothetical protein
MRSPPKDPNPEESMRDARRINDLVRAVPTEIPVVDRAWAEKAWEEHQPKGELAGNNELAVAERGGRLALVGRTAAQQVGLAKLKTMPWFWPNGLLPLWTLSFYGRSLLGRSYLEPSEARPLRSRATDLVRATSPS